MSRTVPEWIGKTDDSAIPPRVRLRVWFRFGGVVYEHEIARKQGLVPREQRRGLWLYAERADA